MEARIVIMDENRPDEAAIRYAGRLIRMGKLVAFPTETVYGLGVNALDEKAAIKVYEAKGRPENKALTVHIADMEALFEIASDVPEAAIRLAEKFWPGPLTMILKKNKKVPAAVTANLDTVGVRMPSNEIAKRLIKAAGGFVAAPSANISGKAAPVSAGPVIKDFSDRVDMIIDGGKTRFSEASTIVDMTKETPEVLRKGCYDPEKLKRSFDSADAPLRMTSQLRMTIK